jgi:hypothetical protein
MLVSRPVNCPVCHYSLRGLPASHRCPECGFEYDEHTRIWRPVRRWGVYAILVLVGLWALYEAVQLARAAVATHPALTRQMIIGAVLLPIISVLLFRLWRADRRGRFIAITPYGVFTRSAHGEESIPWHAIEHVTRGRRQVLIRWREQDDGYQLEYIFDTEDEAAAFRIGLEHGNRRYRLSSKARARGDDSRSTTNP